MVIREVYHYIVFIMNRLQVHDIANTHHNLQSLETGIFNKYELSSKLMLHEFDFKCQNNMLVDVTSKHDGSVYMIVNLNSKTLTGVYCQDVMINLPPLANVMLYFEKNETIGFQCEAGKKYDFLLLQIRSSHFESDQKVFLDTMRENKMFKDKLNPNRIVVPNLKIFETAKNLKSINKSKYCNTFIARGYVNIIIGQKFKEFLNKDTYASQTASFRQFEIRQLQQIIKEIEQHPHHQYNIKDLCKKSGLSVSKLQLGFKQMHNCTVAIFIRNVRLDKAVEMLHDSDLNISEIVYSVGLNSRSYFCRIFKKRFNCSPKAYQQQLKHRHLSAS